MKRLVTILCVFPALFGAAQKTPATIAGPKTVGIFYGDARVDSAFYFGVRDTTFTPTRVGASVYRIADSSLYVAVSLTGNRWKKVDSGGSGGGTASWGNITGTLSSQADLVAALGAKQNTLSAGTSSQIRMGDNSLQGLASAVTAITDPLYAANGHSHPGFVPIGGTAGQVLRKNSSTNYDYGWSDDTSSSGGSGIGDMLKSTYDADNDGGVDNSEMLGGVLPSGYSLSGHTHGISTGGTGLTSLGTAGQLLKVTPPGTALEYFTPDFVNAAGVRTTSLIGLSTATTTPVTATDNVLTGFGKLQGQINTINSAGYITSETDPGVLTKLLTGYTVGTNTPLAATDNVLGAFQKLQGQLNNKQPQLSGTGLVRMNGTTLSYDNNSYAILSNTQTFSAVNTFAANVNLKGITYWWAAGTDNVVGNLGALDYGGGTVGGAIFFNRSGESFYATLSSEAQTTNHALTLPNKSGILATLSDITAANAGAQPQLNGTGFVKANGTTISYDNTAYAGLATQNIFSNSNTFTNNIISTTEFTVQNGDSVTASLQNHLVGNDYGANMKMGAVVLKSGSQYNAKILPLRPYNQNKAFWLDNDGGIVATREWVGAQGYGTGSSNGTVTSASVVSANGFAGTVATASSTPAITLSTTVTGILKGNGTAISAATAGTDYIGATGTQTGLTATLLTTGQIGAASLNVESSGTTYAQLGISGTGSTAHGSLLLKSSGAAGRAFVKYADAQSADRDYILREDGTGPLDIATRQWVIAQGYGSGSGSGTVTNFSAGDLSGLFTTSEATTTTTPALSFSLNTQSANTIFAGPVSGGAAAPAFRALVAADLPTSITSNTTGTAAGITGSPGNFYIWGTNGSGVQGWQQGFNLVQSNAATHDFPRRAANGTWVNYSLYTPDYMMKVDINSELSLRKEWQAATLVASTTINLSTGFKWKGTMAANITSLSFLNPQDGHSIKIKIKQPASGGPYSITWPSSFRWPGGTDGVLSTTANAVDELYLDWDSTDGTYSAILVNDVKQ